jgi:gas vesicle protein
MTDYERYGDYQPGDRGFGMGSALAFVFIGLTAGALVALLLAPQPGQKTRRMLRRRYEDAMEGITERADALREQADAWRERGGEWAESARQSIPFRKSARYRR